VRHGASVLVASVEGLQTACQPAAQARHVGRTQHLVQGKAQHLFGPIAQLLLDRGAEVEIVVLVQVVEPKHVARVLGQQAVLRLALAEGAFDAPQLLHLAGGLVQALPLDVQVERGPDGQHGQQAGQRDPGALDEGSHEHFRAVLLDQQPPVGAHHRPGHAVGRHAPVVQSLDEHAGQRLRTQGACADVACVVARQSLAQGGVRLVTQLAEDLHLVLIGAEQEDVRGLDRQLAQTHRRVQVLGRVRVQHHRCRPGTVGCDGGDEGQAQLALGIAPRTGALRPVGGQCLQHGGVQRRVDINRGLARAGRGGHGAVQPQAPVSIHQLDALEDTVVDEKAHHELPYPQRIGFTFALRPLQPAFAQVDAALGPARITQALGLPVADLARPGFGNGLQAGTGQRLLFGESLPGRQADQRAQCQRGDSQHSPDAAT